MELLMRIAEDKFIKNSIVSTYYEAMSRRNRKGILNYIEKIVFEKNSI